MAYDRYDTRRERERGRFSDHDRQRGSRDDRGFFERAGDEIASWFGDDERRREDERMNRGWSESRDRDRYNFGGWGGEPDRERFASRGRDWERARFEDEDRGYRPMSSSSGDREQRSSYGGYGDISARGAGYGSSGFAGTYSGYGAGSDRGYGSSGWGGAFTGSDYERRDMDRRGYDRSEEPWGRDDYRRTSSAGAGGHADRHYEAWRQRQLDELDSDYDEYRREHQQRFESDFGSWRQNRQQKRGMLGQVREQMDVVGSDGETIGKVDCVRGDHIVLTKSDSDDNRHHMVKCTMVDTIDGDQVRLNMPAEEAKSRFRDEDERGFFGREERGETNLERSFAGTYR
jgi:hypothetical protein